MLIRLDLDCVNRARVNQQAVKKRIQDVLSSRILRGDLQSQWLIRAIQCIDLTTLAGNY